MDHIISISIFFLTLSATFGVAILSRKTSNNAKENEDLAGRGLNKWLIGLSAGTTGNSGFIVTGAVGLGYVGGVHWIFMPISWMLGDFLFWHLFPSRINKFGRKNGIVTISELISVGLEPRISRVISVLVSILIVISLSGYTAGQWLAGKKMLSGIFQISDFWATVFFALTVVSYSSIGGFRGSVYTDTFQSVIRLLGTALALVGIVWSAISFGPAFWQNLSNAGDGFLLPFYGQTIGTILGFVFGFAFAAIGFGLGQPQIVTRYLAGQGPEETKSAWWIYIGFVQLTWIAMTVFGVMLRGVMPGLSDPEAGLSAFFQKNMGPVLTGIIIADIFATISSTSNGILIAISQSVKRDLLGFLSMGQKSGSLITILVGFATIFLSMVLKGDVYTIIISSASLLGAGLGGAVMIKILEVPHSGESLLFSIVGGASAGIAWKMIGFDGIFNEAGIGILCALFLNYVVFRMVQEMRLKKSETPAP